MTTVTPGPTAAPEGLAQDQYADGFASRWDELVDWSRRGRLEGSFLSSVAGDAPGIDLFDMACGTGFHAAMFARLGYEVDAIDGSADMVSQAQLNLARLGYEINVHQRDWSSLSALPTASYDVVVCLGSSIPHADAATRPDVLRQAHDLLRPGGVLLVDHRNFDFIVDHGELPPGRSVYGESVQVALAAADEERTTFSYDYSDGFSRTLTVSSLRFEELRHELRDAGFARVDSFADGVPVEKSGASGFHLHRAVRSGRPTLHRTLGSSS